MRTSSTAKAIVFPGQGSQRSGMGGDLFEAFPDLVATADAVLGFSVKELVQGDADPRLNDTRYTQPALFVVNALSYLSRRAQLGNGADYFAGHSLGEYNALWAAEAFDFETGVRLVKRRGELMAKVENGSMSAVIGLGIERIEELLQEPPLNALDIANINSPSQVVLAGPPPVLAEAKSVFDQAGARLVHPLRVSGAFHSRYMANAGAEFETFLKAFEFREPAVPVISNVEARPHVRERIPELLARQITHPVKWCETVRYLMGSGVEDFIELGPGQVLTGLIKTIQQEATPLEVLDEPMAADVTVPGGSGDETPSLGITPEGLGSRSFREDYGVRYAYVSGSMYKGIASKELVVRMGRAGLIGYLGTGGLMLEEIEESLRYIQTELQDGQVYGMNLLHNPVDPAMEDRTIDLYLRHGVRNIEAAAYIDVTPSVVRFRLKGIEEGASGNVISRHRVIAKVSRPEVAEVFMRPPHKRILEKLLSRDAITPREAELACRLPVADDICVESDSGGHTDQGIALVLLPAMRSLRDRITSEMNYAKPIRLGAAGGIGTPEAAAAAFLMGADFVLTGSINQCTVEAGTSETVKEMLQDINVQDTAYAPAGDMFELGARIQVLRKGLFFPTRANKLYDLYRQFNALDELDAKTVRQIEEKYFHRSFAEVWEETRAYLAEHKPDELDKAARNAKHKMALVFRWYFAHSSRLAMEGSDTQRVDYQVHCGPALGAFNQWVKGTSLESWRNRHVDEIAERLMNATAELLTERFRGFLEASVAAGREG